MPRFPEDRFDSPPETLGRVGAHRGPQPRGRGWVRFAWGALASGLLVVGGVAGLAAVDPEFKLPLPSFAETATPAPTVTGPPPAEAITDPKDVPDSLKVDISVFNASGVSGLESDAASEIHKEGWPTPAKANASGTQAKTVVYYWSAEYEGVARGMMEIVGAAEIQLTDAYPGAPITIVLGTDKDPSATATDDPAGG